MRIQSFYLHNVRGLPDIKLDLVDRATGRARSRTVIAGSNGTGKTTILDAIYALLELARGTKPAWMRPNEAQAGIVVTDLPFSLDYPLAIEVGNREQLVGIAYLSGRRAVSSGPEPEGPTITYTGQPAEWMPATIEEAEAGESDFPNCLYFPSEGRELQPKEIGQVMGEPRSYQWVYRFSDSQKWQGSLESFLVALDYRDLLTEREGRAGGGEFRRFVKVINQFLQGRQIVGVDQTSFRIQVRGNNDRPFSIDALSSGEKQILLMLGEIQRRLRQGGILLIDEPEIHLHPRWQRLLVRALTDLCIEHNAQLIITTHSEEVASAVYEHELVLLDAIFAQEPLP